MFLEQYYLLTGGFELNTQNIVNFTVNQGKSVYIYDKDKKILYYQSISLSELKSKLSIHPVTVTKYLNKESLFLNYFVLTDKLIVNTNKLNLSLMELNDFLSDKRRLANQEILPKRVSKAITLKEVKSGIRKDFPSLVAVVRYLESKGIKADRNIISKRLDTNNEYHGYYYYYNKSDLATHI